MTKRLTGASHSPRPRSPNILPIGHLSNKSTVYSPTSMSRMSQDLVYNHMRSHYQRIASAKACVDTSAPKTLKLTTKGRDRKRREALQSSLQDTPARPPSSSRRTNSEGEGISRNDQNKEYFSASNSIVGRTHNQSMTNDSAKDINSKNGMASAQFRRNQHKNSRNNDSMKLPLQMEKGRSLFNNFSHDLRGCSSASNQEDHYSKYERTNNVVTNHAHSPLTNSPHGVNNTRLSLKQFDDLEETGFDRQYTSTPRFERERERQSDLLENSALHLSNMTFSYKEPPSPRRKNKKSPEELIWTEEQKYLNFISDVTNDVLARGIFSNRVLNRVFESHIEKRKDDLDEDHMVELINQLKQDLGITDC